MEPNSKGVWKAIKQTNPITKTESRAQTHFTAKHFSEATAYYCKRAKGLEGHRLEAVFSAARQHTGQKAAVVKKPFLPTGGFYRPARGEVEDGDD